ncbi:exopolysaccharide biosynthesis protein [Acidobacteriia bacterium AH_259_A11_L15]|nr:exopolysaccharide biosynthesis protein [Acidobacteriia bacterium AH_259_A11_L15]
MIDIHSHFLPGLDDGAKSVEEAVAMIEMAAGDGTTHLVGTPHCNDRFAFSPERNRALLGELQERVGNGVVLLSGCDFHVSYQNLERVLTEKATYTLNQGTYLLTEFANYGIAPQTLNIFHRLRLNELVPIITHPERNRLLREKLLRRLVGMGCPVQITAGSLTGRFGAEAQQAAERLLTERLVHFVASDAHDTRRRPPRLSRARARVAAKWGEEVARALFVENPRAALDSRPLPYFPEPAQKRKRRFWFF